MKGQWAGAAADGLSEREAMAIGTAGYTAMLAVMALERHGLTPDRGPGWSRARPAVSARWRLRSLPSLASR